MNILVSLVSGQTIPNVQFIKSKNDEIDGYLFLTTQQMEKRGNRVWILDSLGILEEDIDPPLIVDEYSFKDIEEKLNDRVTDENHYIVNLTGGTKIMSLAVRDFFKDMDAEMYYLPGNRTEIKVHPGKNKTVKPLEIDLSLEEYLKAYGFNLDKKSSPCFDFETNSKILAYFLNGHDSDKDKEALEYLRKKRGKKIGDLSHKNSFEVKAFIERLGIKTTETNRLNEEEVKSLSGEWLEDYLFQYIINEFKVPEDVIGLGLVVVKNDVRNEFDVLLMKNDRLYLFECKTSIFINEETQKTFIGETIYKSDSLRNKFGLFTQTVIVTLSDLQGDSMKKHIDRANVSRVKLIDRNGFVEGLKEALIKI